MGSDLGEPPRTSRARGKARPDAEAISTRGLLAAAAVVLLSGVAASGWAVGASAGDDDQPALTRSPVVVPPDPMPRALITATGVVVTVLDARADGSHVVRTPCAHSAVVSGGHPLHVADVVLDPGHGGPDSGAVGPTGLQEKAVNLAVALGVRDRLEALGIRVVLTRSGDHQVALASRAEIATSLGALAFVSIHHNSGIDLPLARPGTDAYYQVADAASKGLAELIWQEMDGRLGAFDLPWVGLPDAGPRSRRDRDGADFYSVLRRSSGVPGVLVEAGYISNPAEAALLATTEYQTAEADAIAAALVQWLPVNTAADDASRAVIPTPPDDSETTLVCDDPTLE